MPTAPMHPTQPQRLAVLLVDPNVASRRSLRATLERGGHSVASCPHVDDALPLAARAFDVGVFSAHPSAPRQRLSTLVDALAPTPCGDLPFVLASELDFGSARQLRHARTAVELVRKPCTEASLHGALRRALGRRRAPSARRSPPPSPLADLVDALVRRAQPSLSAREREVLTQLIALRPEAQLCRRSRIAERLGLSPNTVRTHMRAVFRKLQVHNTEDLLRQALLD